MKTEMSNEIKLIEEFSLEETVEMLGRKIVDMDIDEYKHGYFDEDDLNSWSEFTSW